MKIATASITPRLTASDTLKRAKPKLSSKRQLRVGRAAQLIAIFPLVNKNAPILSSAVFHESGQTPHLRSTFVRAASSKKWAGFSGKKVWQEGGGEEGLQQI